MTTAVALWVWHPGIDARNSVPLLISYQSSLNSQHFTWKPQPWYATLFLVNCRLSNLSFFVLHLSLALAKSIFSRKRPGSLLKLSEAFSIAGWVVGLLWALDCTSWGQLARLITSLTKGLTLWVLIHESSLKQDCYIRLISRTWLSARKAAQCLPARLAFPLFLSLHCVPWKYCM